jgi:hypothetical protein
MDSCGLQVRVHLARISPESRWSRVTNYIYIPTSISEGVDPRLQTFLEPINTLANDCSALLYEHRPWRRKAWRREI